MSKTGRSFEMSKTGRSFEMSKTRRFFETSASWVRQPYGRRLLAQLDDARDVATLLSGKKPKKNF